MNTKKSAKPISSLLKAIGPAPRIRILVGVGFGEVCVCHLEALLGWRQAYISQHLMALRRSGILTARREGRFVYYRLREPGILELLEHAAGIVGVQLSRTEFPVGCTCPGCASAEHMDHIGLQEKESV